MDTVDVIFAALPPPPTPDPEPEPEPVLEPTFEDVQDANVHREAIGVLGQYEITAGTSRVTFSPALELSRQQMATFMVRLLAHADASVSRPADHDEAMALLRQRGLMHGTADGDLQPGRSLTRAQATSLLVRLIEQVTGEELPVVDSTPFSDIAGSVQVTNIAKLTEAGVVAGKKDGTFQPGATLRRDQMASLLARVIEYLVDSGQIERRQ